MISVAAVSATGVVGDADVLYAHVPSTLAIDRSSDSADEDSGFGTSGLIAMAIVIIVIFIGSIFFMALRSNQQASINSDLKFELNQMKLGIEELTDQVKKLFSEEFAKTIGDAIDVEEKLHRLETDPAPARARRGDREGCVRGSLPCDHGWPATELAGRPRRGEDAARGCRVGRTRQISGRGPAYGPAGSPESGKQVLLAPVVRSYARGKSAPRTLRLARAGVSWGVVL